jgi:hypothetical protein
VVSKFFPYLCCSHFCGIVFQMDINDKCAIVIYKCKIICQICNFNLQVHNNSPNVHFFTSAQYNYQMCNCNFPQIDNNSPNVHLYFLHKCTIIRQMCTCIFCTNAQ